MTTQSFRIKEVYKIGPRKVTTTAKRASVYLGKDFNFLIGKKVLITIEVLDEDEK